MKLHEETVTMMDTIKNVTAKNDPNMSFASNPLPNSSGGNGSPENIL
jgi:hypothetical protein